MAKRGRPTLFTPEVEEKIIALFAYGLSGRQVAEYMGIDYSSLRKKMKRDKGFGTKCRAKKITKFLLASRNEMEMLERGDPAATFNVLAREERRRHNRHNERMRERELKLRKENGGILPAILNLNDAVAEINDAFTNRPADEESEEVPDDLPET